MTTNNEISGIFGVVYDSPGEVRSSVSVVETVLDVSDPFAGNTTAHKVGEVTQAPGWANGAHRYASINGWRVPLNQSCRIGLVLGLL
ncbi:MAG: hypothetical protein ABIW81_01000 [Terrimesophilobacter sp.]